MPIWFRSSVRKKNDMEIDERFAYLTSPSGRRYQVFNEEGTDWDEVATTAAYAEGEKDA